MTDTRELKFNPKENRRHQRGSTISLVGIPLLIVGMLCTMMSAMVSHNPTLRGAGAVLFMLGGVMFVGGWQYAEGAVSSMYDRYRNG